MPNRVLVVEDDNSLRDFIRMALELEGYEVDTAPDGVEALRRFEEAPAGVIVLDLMMPRLDGFGFVAEFERRGLRERAGLLVVTADGRAAAKAARVRADGWLEKPFDLTDLLDQISRLMGDG